MTQSPPTGPGVFMLYFWGFIACMLLAAPWIITGLQHYYYWVFTITGFK